MSAPYTTAKSGQPYKKNSGVILKVAAGANAPTIGLTEMSNASFTQNYGSNSIIPTGHENSGNIGVQKIYASRPHVFSPYLNTNNYIAIGLPHNIAGTSSNLLRSGAADFGQRAATHKFYGYQRSAVSIDLYTGVATKAAHDGATILASGLNGVTGREADKAEGTDAVPFEFTAMEASVNPTRFDGKARTSS